MTLKRTATDITVGTQLAPVTVELTAEIVREYAEVVGDTTSWYREAFDAPVAPPAFLSILAGKPLDATYEPVPGGIHASQEFELLRPLLIGSQVTVTGTVVDKFDKRGRTYVVVETAYHDQEGNLLARGRSESIVPAACKGEEDDSGNT
jgi:acyl dehydratase